MVREDAINRWSTLHCCLLNSLVLSLSESVKIFYLRLLTIHPLSSIAFKLCLQNPWLLWRHLRGHCGVDQEKVELMGLQVPCWVSVRPAPFYLVYIIGVSCNISFETMIFFCTCLHLYVHTHTHAHTHWPRPMAALSLRLRNKTCWHYFKFQIFGYLFPVHKSSVETN